MTTHFNGAAVTIAPYDCLCVDSDAGDAEIKKAYLAKVREFPPEQAPERFQEIRAAYELIKTQKARLTFEIFAVSPPSINDLIDCITGDRSPQRLDEKTLSKWLVELASPEDMGPGKAIE